MVKRAELLDAINGYGQVFGLPDSEEGNLVGSLMRLSEFLDELAGGEDDMAAQAGKTRSAIYIRERMNGTPAEEADPQGFKMLTGNVVDQLSKLRVLVQALAE